jgi:Restriction endonuclease NaeI
MNLTKEFEIPNGSELDWSIDGHDLDCKFSKDIGGWEIPMEMYVCEEHGGRSGSADHPALLLWLNDDTSQWAAGLLRVTDFKLGWRNELATGLRKRAYNRDNKRRIDNSCSEISTGYGAAAKKICLRICC